MDQITLFPSGAVLTPLRRIESAKGSVYHAIKNSDEGFRGFGEAYFSTVIPGSTKGWKRHKVMTLNLVVPVGSIKFHLRSSDGLLDHAVILGESNYGRLTVPPGLWVAFTGIGQYLNLLLNVADTPHDPNESETLPLDSFPIDL